MAGQPRKRARRAAAAGTPQPEAPPPEKRYRKFDEVMADRVCEGVARGEPIAVVCTRLGIDKHTPAMWSHQMPDFRDRLLDARRSWALFLSDDIVQMADTAQQVVAEAEAAGRNGNAAASALRVAIDGKKWVLSRLWPAVYGDHVTVAGDPSHPLIPAEQPIERTAAAILALLEAARRDPVLPPTIDATPAVAEPVPLGLPDEAAASIDDGQITPAPGPEVSAASDWSRPSIPFLRREHAAGRVPWVSAAELGFEPQPGTASSLANPTLRAIRGGRR